MAHAGGREIAAASLACVLACATLSTPRPPACPTASQGAIIIVGVLALVDYPEFIYLWRTNKFDLLVGMAAGLL